MFIGNYEFFYRFQRQLQSLVTFFFALNVLLLSCTVVAESDVVEAEIKKRKRER
jgi:hypothetical protein